MSRLLLLVFAEELILFIKLDSFVKFLAALSSFIGLFVCWSVGLLVCRSVTAVQFVYNPFSQFISPEELYFQLQLKLWIYPIALGVLTST